MRVPVNLSCVEPVALKQRKHDIKPAPPPKVISRVKIGLERVQACLRVGR
jgi:hypothetical protein